MCIFTAYLKAARVLITLDLIIADNETIANGWVIFLETHALVLTALYCSLIIYRYIIRELISA